MSDIRVTHSGFIAFTSSFIILVVTLLFTIIVTRSLTVEEYGAWNLILGVLMYGLILDSVISFWTTRNIARGVMSGRTSLFSSGILSVAGVILYLIISFFTSLESDVDFSLVIFSSVLIPLRYLQRVISSVNMGHRPQVISYANIISESSKLLIGFTLIHFFDLHIIGVIFSFAIAYVISILYQTYYSKDFLKERFNLQFLKESLKLFWIPMFGKLPDYILRTDIIIFPFIFNSLTGVAFFSAATIIGSLVTYAKPLSSSIYPKLLAGGKTNYINENLRIMFYFAIPLMVSAIIFAKTGLQILNPIYESASNIVLFLSLKTLLLVLTSIFSSFIIGTDKTDVNKNLHPIKYIKSSLFSIPLLLFIQNIAYIISFVFVLTMLKNNQVSENEILLFWSMLGLITQLPMTILLFYLSRKKLKISLEYFALLKYLLISIAIFTIFNLVLEEYFIYTDELLSIIPIVLPIILSSFVAYFIITYFVDVKTRNLMKIILSNMKKQS